MAYIKYQNSNNASTVLLADIGASSTTILITSGDEALFPSTYPFLLTLEHKDSDGNVLIREIVKVTAGVSNSFTIVRGAGTCVQDDTATPRVQSSSSHSFYAGDSVSLYRTAEQVEDIQDRLWHSSSSSAVAPDYEETAVYEIGDVVMYDGQRYVCSTDVTTPEAFDPSKWTMTSIQEELAQLGGGKYVDVLVVGGGAGGGGTYGIRTAGGGGGGGGVCEYLKYPVALGNIAVKVGQGGAGGIRHETGGNGGNSAFAGILVGGGGGGGSDSNCPGADSYYGGGAGGAGVGCGTAGTPGISYGYGGHGANSGRYSSSGCTEAGGGGGAKGTGGMPSWSRGNGGTCMATRSTIGGLGYGSSIDGTGTIYGTGGGGGGESTLDVQLGGAGGGAGFENGADAICYGGGGGGGNSWCCSGCKCGGAGCQGIVIVRYPTDGSYGVNCATGGDSCQTITENGIEYCVHKFTTTGDSTFSIIS